jgi:nucleotide-binding universal stress UspA family protein
MKRKMSAAPEDTGFRHILVPTDGTEFSAHALGCAIRLAKLFKARLTGVHVVAPYARSATALALLPGFRRSVRRQAQRALAAFRDEARTQGVPADAVTLVGSEPGQAILLAAKKHHCDLIVMASHGRGSLAGLLLGSETSKVLALSSVPVLVCR